LKSKYGKGITFLDIDETIFRSFAMVYVIKDGVVIKKLTNQEYNTYKLEPGESFNFKEFRNAEIFNKTSIPIEKTISRIKRMFKNIDRRGSKVVLLTARADFDNKETFLNTFRRYGLPIDDMYVERTGNFYENPDIYKSIIAKQGMPKSISDAKRKVILNYISTGLYRRVRLMDDDMDNITDFVKLEKDIPESIINKIKKIHNVQDGDTIPVIEFFGLLVKPNGSLQRIK